MRFALSPAAAMAALLVAVLPAGAQSADSDASNDSLLRRLYGPVPVPGAIGPAPAPESEASDRAADALGRPATAPPPGAADGILGLDEEGESTGLATLAEPTPVPAPTPTPTVDLPDLRFRPITPVAPIGTVVRPGATAAAAATPATGPVPLPVDREADARALYAPQGLRLGSFGAFASSRASVGTSTQDGAYWSEEATLDLRSDWERHRLDLSLRGRWQDEFDGGDALPVFGAVVDGRLDLTEVDRIGLSAAYGFSREDAGDADLAAGASRSDVTTLSASAGYERSAGLIGFGLRGAVDRTTYSASAARDNTALSASLRLGLDQGAVIEPFVEGGAFLRLYDDGAADGASRDTIGGELKAGFVVEGATVSGELAVGYAREEARDGDASTDGVAVEGSLAWAPTPLATFTLSADTRFEPTSIDGVTSAVERTLALDAAYALRPNLLVSAGASFEWQDFGSADRTVTTTTIRGGAAWLVSPMVELGLTASHEIVGSSVAGGDSRDTRVEASVTLRR